MNYLDIPFLLKLLFKTLSICSWISRLSSPFDNPFWKGDFSSSSSPFIRFRFLICPRYSWQIKRGVGKLWVWYAWGWVEQKRDRGLGGREMLPRISQTFWLKIGLVTGWQKSVSLACGGGAIWIAKKKEENFARQIDKHVCKKGTLLLKKLSIY